MLPEREGMLYWHNADCYEMFVDKAGSNGNLFFGVLYEEGSTKNESPFM